jgi:hypothetical protein
MASCPSLPEEIVHKLLSLMKNMYHDETVSTVCTKSEE